ncbi:hypothetical protein GCM10027037_19450 [Mucilaginibacter koreensis]
MPIANAGLSSANTKTFSDVNGRFTLYQIKPGDTVNITHPNYQPYYYTVKSKSFKDTLVLYLTSYSMILRPVIINGKRDFKKDSVRNRKEFASVFNYKAPTIKDAFITRSPYAYKPPNYIDAPNNTTSLVSVNLLSVVSLLGKHKAPKSRLQKNLIRDEQVAAVDQSFSRSRVSAITGLKGDSLQLFMEKYRPSLGQVHQMNDYELMLYIKNSYTDFTGSRK